MALVYEGKRKTLHRTKIEWTEYVWNLETGCNHGCWYCYAKTFAIRFKSLFPNGFTPTFYPCGLSEAKNLKKPHKIFVCSVADLFASWTPVEWRDKILEAVEECPIQHTFQLLTKNPEMIPLNHIFPDNIWVGTTVTNDPKTKDWVNIEAIKQVHAKVRFVSFEPLLGELPDTSSLEGVQWVIIGKLTGSRRVSLDMNWVEGILLQCSMLKIPVFVKNNIGMTDQIQEYPVN